MRNRATSIIVAAVILVAIGIYLWRTFVPGPMAFAGGSTVALADYHAADLTGVPAELAGADPVKRGEYLARAADCMVCHTAPGGTPYAGGLAIPLPFGTIYTTNITADKATGIGNYSDADFLNAVQRGIRPDGSRLYPAMPFPSYTFMTDADALAIKAYLLSLPAVHAENRVDTLAFPFNQRWSVFFWSLAFNPNMRFAPNTAHSPEWNRGAYLAQGLAHCSTCHTPRNALMAEDGKRFLGGSEVGGWYAPNISSDLKSGIAGWTREELVRYLSGQPLPGKGSAAGPVVEAIDHSQASESRRFAGHCALYQIRARRGRGKGHAACRQLRPGLGRSGQPARRGPAQES